MVAFPPPPVTLRQRSSTFVEPLCSLRRVLASGCHSFLFEWLEKVSQPSLAEPFGSDKGVIESTAACLFSRSGVTAPIADPFLGLEGRNPRDRKVYTPSQIFRSNFSVFYLLRIFSYSIFFNAAAIFSFTTFISSSSLYLVRGQKKPFNPSFLRRGTTCTCKCGTL